MPNGKKTNDILIALIAELKKKAHENKAPIWKDLAKRLEKPNSSWAKVNLSHLAKYSDKGDTVVIPGKLLGAGDLTYPVTVAAFSFSESAKNKVEKAGGRGISIPELIDKNPKGTGIRIIG